jgi:hypothetical protein
MNIRLRTFIASCIVVAALGVAVSAQRGSEDQRPVPVPTFKADPWWPKPLPQVTDADGQLRRWVTGGVGGVCIDSHDHIFTLNRGGTMGSYEGMSGVLSPEVIVYNTAGDVIDSWGKRKEGEPPLIAATAHGCTVDYQDNVWLTGLGDGVAQKFSHDGKFLSQIGVKGQCDGPPDSTPQAKNPTCGEKGAFNTSKTLLNNPANLWVDPGPDPVTKEPGSVYIADGYGNFRVVVFDKNGKFLRQWGEPGKGPGQFGYKEGEDKGPGAAGGHPHCVALSKDGFLYACDRANNRIQEFDKTGNLKRIIPINPPGGLRAAQRTADVAFSTDPQQTYLYDTDLGNNVIRILERKSGKIVGQIGVGPGRTAEQLITPHQLAVDSKGNVYVASTTDSNRIQRFIKQ